MNSTRRSESRPTSGPHSLRPAGTLFVRVGAVLFVDRSFARIMSGTRFFSNLLQEIHIPGRADAKLTALASLSRSPGRYGPVRVAGLAAGLQICVGGPLVSEYPSDCYG